MLVALKDSNRFLELVNTGPDSEVGAAGEEHLRGDKEVQDHTGVPVKCLLQINCFHIYFKNFDVKKCFSRYKSEGLKELE